MGEERGGTVRSPLSQAAVELYGLAARSQGLPVAAEGVPPGGPLWELLKIGLLVQSSFDPHRYSVVHPQVIAPRWGLTLHAEAMQALGLASALPDLVEQLAAFHEQGQFPREAVQKSGFDVLRGYTEINVRIEHLIQGALERFMTLQPGPRSQALLDDSLERDRKLIQQLPPGARRNLYQTSTRYNPAIRAYVKNVTELGARVRTVAELPLRLFVIDDVAVLPVTGGAGSPQEDREGMTAVLVYEPAVVAYVVSVFEMLWAQGTDFTGSLGNPAEITQLLQARIVELLSKGHQEQAIAKRLQLSTRTCADHIRQLKEQYDATTLFELGWKIRASGAFADVDDES